MAAQSVKSLVIQHQDGHMRPKLAHENIELSMISQQISFEDQLLATLPKMAVAGDDHIHGAPRLALRAVSLAAYTYRLLEQNCAVGRAPVYRNIDGVGVVAQTTQAVL